MARYLVRLHNGNGSIPLWRSWSKLERKQKTSAAMHGPHVDGVAVSVIQARSDAAILKAQFTVVQDWKPIHGGYVNV